MTSFGVVAPSSDKRKELITSMLKVIHWSSEFSSTSILGIWLVSREHPIFQSNHSYGTNIHRLRCFARVCPPTFLGYVARIAPKDCIEYSPKLWLRYFQAPNLKPHKLQSLRRCRWCDLAPRVCVVVEPSGCMWLSPIISANRYCVLSCYRRKQNVWG